MNALLKQARCRMILNNLILAIAIVESSLNPLAVGDDGKAWGALQIHMCVIEDVNKFYKKDFTSQDRLSFDKSQDIFKYYTDYWSTVYEKDTGKIADFEILAKIWHGGAYGYKKPHTEIYWLKVKKQLDKINKLYE